MSHNRLARGTAAAAGTLAGLGLFFLCLSTVSAHGTTARTTDVAAAHVWHVDKSLGEGQVGYWKFDEVSGNRTLNSSLLNNPTTLINGATITTSVPATVSIPDAGSLLLDGVNDAVVVSDTTNLDVPVNSFSLAAWVRRVYTATHTADLIYDSGTQAGQWYFGFLANDRLTFTINGVKDYTSTFTVADSNWHHVAAVVSGTLTNDLTIYLDGVPAPTLSAVITTTPSGPKLIGNKTGSFNTPFSGNIDELRLYNRALSAAEVGRLAAGRGCVVDGATWPAAFVDLQCALDVAASGDQIWIAGGTYRPGTNRAVSFRLVDGVSVFGGFDGSETSPAQRPPFDPNAPMTALSGDAAGDDVRGSFDHYGENSCNVLMAGSLAIPGSISASLDGLAVQDGSADAAAGCANFPSVANGGGLADVSPNQLALNNIVFRFNVASGQGGGLFNTGGRLSLSGAHFISNTADVGGGLALGGGLVTITTSSFVSNTASLGGALGIHPAVDPAFLPITLTVAGTSFTGNTAQDGGALEDQIGDRQLDLSFDQVNFTNNQSTVGDGGAVSSTGFNQGVVRTRINQSTFTGNIAGEDGGAVQSFGEQLTISGSQFTSNASPFSAGGALAAQSAVTVTNSNFMSNTAQAGGGALEVIGSLALVDSNVSFNRAIDTNANTESRPMGAGALVSGTALVTDTHFVGNQAFLANITLENLAGGGGLAVSGSLALSGGDFRNNSAAQGAGLQVLGSANIARSLFQFNFAREGGAVFADGDLVLVSSRLLDNQAVGSVTSAQPGLGGGVFLTHGGLSGKISNNLFLGNRAACNLGCSAHGSAFSIDGFSTLVSNNTIVNRGLTFGEPGSAASVTGTTGLFNNIITSYTVGIEALGGQTFDDYNLFHGNTVTATGAINSPGHSRSADPRFVDPTLDNYQLRLNSPAVDAGDNSRVPNFVTTDLAGGPRFIDVPAVPDTGAGTPPLVDIGAFETAAKSLFLPVIRK